MRNLRIATLIAVSCLLGACVTPKQTQATTAAVGVLVGGAAAASPKIAAAVNTVNAKIAAASAVVSQKCLTAKLLIGGTQLVTNTSATGLLKATQILVDDYCSAPPVDVASAATLLTGAVADLQANGITVKSVTQLHLLLARQLHRRARRVAYS